MLIGKLPEPTRIGIEDPVVPAGAPVVVVVVWVVVVVV